jgi:hypothetical protein
MLRGSLLAAVEAARAIPEALGLRTIRVWIRAATRTQPALVPGGVTSTVDTELAPRPAVVRLETVDPSYWGAEAVGLVQGTALAEVYQIGPITPAHDGGGYSYADLVPLTTTTTQASRVLLADAEAGGLLGTTPVEFEVVSVKGQDKGRSLRWELLVRRVRNHETDG